MKSVAKKFIFIASGYRMRIAIVWFLFLRGCMVFLFDLFVSVHNLFAVILFVG